VRSSLLSRARGGGLVGPEPSVHRDLHTGTWSLRPGPPGHGTKPAVDHARSEPSAACCRHHRSAHRNILRPHQISTHGVKPSQTPARGANVTGGTAAWAHRAARKASGAAPPPPPRRRSDSATAPRRASNLSSLPPRVTTHKAPSSRSQSNRFLPRISPSPIPFRHRCASTGSSSKRDPGAGPQSTTAQGARIPRTGQDAGGAPLQDPAVSPLSPPAEFRAASSSSALRLVPVFSFSPDPSPWVFRLLFGYAMPAFECFKTVETRPNDAHMLRFWCQYW
jgi:hypothetical protein